MNKKFNGFTVENNGVRSIEGGGTSANTATGALFNLGIHPSQIIYSSGNLIGNQIVSGQLISSFSNGDVQVPLGFSNYAFVRNLDSNLSKGQVVYIAGAQGDRAAVRKASNTGEATSSKTFGIAAHPISAGSDGYVITNGNLQNLNILNGYNIGDSLWLGSTNGSMTNIKPVAPNHSVFLGVVEKPGNGNNGIMYVKIQNGQELNEIHDVQIMNPLSGQFIVRNDSNDLWVNKTVYASDFSAISHNILSFWHANTSTANNAFLYFANIDFSPTQNRENRFVTINENCVARSASWNHYVTTTGSAILDATGYFINLTKNTTGTISAGIKAVAQGALYNFTGLINPPIFVSAGDKVNIGWGVPNFGLTTPGSVGNSVDIYFYSK